MQSLLLAALCWSICSGAAGGLIPFASLEVLGDGACDPIQLIRRGSNGDPQIVEAGISSLIDLAGQYHILGVVGNLHTGKSFLLNRLMGRMSGFATGPTVNPTTEGVWFWGCPVTDPDSGLQVLLLDSEGLSAPGNNPDYDAKIFAVTTLLSSHLLYNSVKIIDEAAMEYLQILSRRAQLFSLQSTLNMDGPFEGVLRFPQLTWVVQDFFQLQVNNETPTQWLHRLIQQQASARGFEGLDKIFPQAECMTLFLPATERAQLQNLDELDSSQLTAEYSEDLQSLIVHVITKLRLQAQEDDERVGGQGQAGSPVCKPDPHGSEDSTAVRTSQKDSARCNDDRSSGTGYVRSVRTGATIAALARTLVDAANNGGIANMPSMWGLFIEAQVTEALRQGDRLFKRAVASVVELDPPQVTAVYEDSLSHARDVAMETFSNALFNLDNDVTQMGSQRLARKLQELTLESLAAHRHRLGEYLRQKQEETLDTAGQRIAGLAVPMATTELKAILDKELNPLEEAMDALAQTYSSNIHIFSASMDGLRTKILHENELQHRVKMQKVQDRVILEYRQTMEREIKPSKPVSGDALRKMQQAAEIDAMEKWNNLSSQSKAEDTYAHFQGSLENTLHTLHETFQKKNSEHVQKHCRKLGDRVMKTAKAAFRTQSNHLPLEDAPLQKLLQEIRDQAERAFQEDAREFAPNPGLEAAGKELADRLLTARRRVTKANVLAWTEKVEKPLAIARRRSLDLLPSHWLVWTFESRARAIAHEEISHSLPVAMRSDVVDNWMHDPDKGLGGQRPGLGAKSILVAVIAVTAVLVLALCLLRRGGRAVSI